MSPSRRGPVRVLAWPADGNRTGNPYNAILAAGLRSLGVAVDEFSPPRLLSGGYDIFHAHWPDGALRRGRAGAAALLGATAAARLRGTRVVWTVHNLRAHAPVSPRVEGAFWKRWTGLVDASIHLSPSARDAALDSFPALRERPTFIVPHPHYRGVYPSPPDRAEARASLGLPSAARVAVFAGHVRAYKGAPALVRAFRGMDDPGALLLVAGRPESPAVAAELRDAAGDSARVMLRLAHVADDQLPVVVGASDVVVLPYRELLNSGVALLALSLDRPVLVPAVGAMADLRDAVGVEWVHTYGGEIRPEVVARALDTCAARPPAPPAPLEAFAPDAVSRATLEVYGAVAAGGRR